MPEERRRDYPNIMDKLDGLCKDVSEVKKLLFGNGHIGLCEQVRKNCEKIEDLCKVRSDSGRWITWFIQTVTVIMLGIMAKKLWQ